MKTFAGGSSARRGSYLSLSMLRFASVPEDDGALPGNAEERWIRIPAAVALAAGPLIGGLFVIALPVLGTGAVIAAVVRKVRGKAARGVDELAATLAPGLIPGESHLAGPGEKGAGVTPGGPPGDEAVARLEAEVSKKRNPTS